MKKLLVVLVVSMFVLMSCAHKEACKSEKEAGCESKADHVCTAACDHSDHKAMAKDHVCTEACDHSADAMAKKHECSAECQAKWMAGHMEKMGADHVCTDACKVAHMQSIKQITNAQQSVKQNAKRLIWKRWAQIMCAQMPVKLNAR